MQPVRLLLDLVPPSGHTGYVDHLVKVQGWANVDAQLWMESGAKVGQVLADRLALQREAAGDGNSVTVYALMILTMKEALYLRRIVIELGEVVPIQWIGWEPDERDVPHLSLKQQAMVGAVKMAVRKAVKS